MVHLEFDVLLTNKGAGVGPVQILAPGASPGIPAPSTLGFSIGGGGQCVTAAMASLTGNVFAMIGGGPVINLYHNSAAGSVLLADTNLTNTSRISGSVTYFDNTL
jgi:hypothetical protein